MKITYICSPLHGDTISSGMATAIKTIRRQSGEFITPTMAKQILEMVAENERLKSENELLKLKMESE